LNATSGYEIIQELKLTHLVSAIKFGLFELAPRKIL
jgi:hypothetical protein